jgi:rhodanese-related sulfurtransferase
MSNDSKRRPLRISLEEAKKRYDEEEVTILDVVDPGTYEGLSQQIKGAVRIDPRKVSDAPDQMPKDRTILAY